MRQTDGTEEMCRTAVEVSRDDWDEEDRHGEHDHKYDDYLRSAFHPLSAWLRWIYVYFREHAIDFGGVG